MSNLDIKEDHDSVTFMAKIVPGSSKTAVVGFLNRAIKIKVAAPPEKGKANQCLIAFLAKRLGIKKQAVTILSGQTNPVKQIQIVGISAQALQDKLGLEI